MIFKAGDIGFSKDIIQYFDTRDLDRLLIHVYLKDGTLILVNGIDAIDFIMAICPKMIEGRRLKWAKHAWAVHNLFGHPIMQILAFFRCYKAAMWIHDVTVPKPKTTTKKF